jgi:hypothetical protein
MLSKEHASILISGFSNSMKKVVVGLGKAFLKFTLGYFQRKTMSIYPSQSNSCISVLELMWHKNGI